MAGGSDVAFPAARYELARLGALIGDCTRATMLLSLLDGDVVSAGVLAARASVSASTASGHLRLLAEGALLRVERRGRYRFYGLANGRVADALVALASLSPIPAITRERLSLEPARQAFRRARICHRHLAGTLGVEVTEALLRDGTLRKRGSSYAITEAGKARLRTLGIHDMGRRLKGSERARPCLDWTEGRAHLGGAVGEALLDHWISSGWFKRGRRGRTLEVTARGARELSHLVDAR